MFLTFPIESLMDGVARSVGSRGGGVARRETDVYQCQEGGAGRDTMWSGREVETYT